MNAEPVIKLLWSSGRIGNMTFVNDTMNSHVRMPYTNSWRIPSMGIRHDCFECTIPASSGKNIIEATFLSVLDYGDIIYKIATPSILKPLDTVYHSALRWVTGDSYGTHHCTLYENAGLPSLSERREMHWYLFVLKAIAGMLPPYICNRLDHNLSPYQTRSDPPGSFCAY